MASKKKLSGEPLNNYPLWWACLKTPLNTVVMWWSEITEQKQVFHHLQFNWFGSTAALLFVASEKTSFNFSEWNTDNIYQRLLANWRGVVTDDREI